MICPSKGFCTTISCRNTVIKTASYGMTRDFWLVNSHFSTIPTWSDPPSQSQSKKIIAPAAGLYPLSFHFPLLRNNTASHEEHIPGLHSQTSHGLPPAPGKTAGRLLHCSRHGFGWPRICTHSHNYSPEGWALACPDPGAPCIRPPGRSMRNTESRPEWNTLDLWFRWGCWDIGYWRGTRWPAWNRSPAPWIPASW